jgi:signal transduction histidine kinase/DNA-binding response OmpR family regulator
MSAYRDIGHKLSYILTVSVGVSLLVLFAIFTPYEVQHRREAKLAELTSMAEVIAFNASAVLEFADRQGAERLFNPLQLHTDLVAAHLLGTALSYRYDSPGKGEPGPAHEALVLARQAAQLADFSHATVVVPVKHLGEVVGVVALTASLEKVWAGMFSDALYFLAAAVLALFIARLIARRMQRSILAALGALTVTARTVAASKDFSLRATKFEADEIGQLADAFNTMLDELSVRDLQLEQKRLQLRNDNAALAEEIAHRKALEEALRDHGQRLEKMAEDLRLGTVRAESANVAKSQFLANMSHEIRTPMNGILGMAQILMMRELSEEERIECARTILNSGRSLLTLLNDILDLSKVEAGKLELQLTPCSPVEVINDVVNFFGETATRKQLVLRAAPRLAAGNYYLADAVRLQQMLTNLVGNAIKFTATGEVVVSVEEVGVNAETSWLEFAVSDTGIGIPQEKLSQLFVPFSQVDGSTTRLYGGTGLGLSIVRNLARLMGGETAVSSQEGRGSRFSFRVPVQPVRDAAGQADTARAEATPGSDAPRLHGNILAAEDDPINRKMLHSTLSRLGLSFRMVGDGGEAVAAVQSGEAYDLILMDLRMPGVDGLEATRRIRAWEAEQQRPRVPIMAVTANAFDEDRARCFDAGMDDFIAKPINLQRFAVMMEKWLPHLAVTPPAPVAAAPAEAGLKTYDPATVLAVLEKLMPQLQNRLFDAVTEFKQLRAALAETELAAEINDIGRAVDLLDFDQALRRLQALVERQGWKLSS